MIEYARTAADELAGVRAGVLPPADEAARIAAAADLARRADRTVLILGTNAEWEAEGRDRASLGLPGRQDELARAVLAADPQVVVVLNVGGPTLMPWLDEAGAVVVPWYPGQAFGAALVDVLSGDADPGGRMPQVWPRRVEDHPATRHGGPKGLTIRYEEGHAFGHRGMAAADTAPLVPFGHGLSYGEATVRMREVVRDEAGLPRNGLAEVATSGDRAATVVVQAYLTVTTPSGVLDILVGWARASLAPGRTATLSVPIDLGAVPPGADPSTACLRLRW